jgi:hypothetical protein
MSNLPFASERTVSYEVSQPILNSPFQKPGREWYIQQGEQPKLRDSRSPPVVFPPRDQKEEWTENLKRVKVEFTRYEESDTSLANRVLGPRAHRHSVLCRETPRLLRPRRPQPAVPSRPQRSKAKQPDAE